MSEVYVLTGPWGEVVSVHTTFQGAAEDMSQYSEVYQRRMRVQEMTVINDG